MGREEREDFNAIISKAVDQAVERATAKQMEPIQKDIAHMKYYFGIACTIIVAFVGVMCIPVIDKVFRHEERLTKYETQLENKADNSFVMEKFLSKEFYAFLEEEQNKATLSIFKDHTQGSTIYQNLNIQNGKQLDIRWRSAREIN